MQNPSPHDLQTILDKFVHDNDIPGASVAVSVDGEWRWAGGSGLADIAAGDVMSPRHCLPIYSLTKSMLAAATLRLVERGVLSLDEPIGRWFPAWPVLAGVTLRQTLNHTGGLPDYGPLASYHAAVRETPGAPWPLEQMLAATVGQGLKSAPGQAFGYSNPGYALLKRMLEQVTGKTLGEALRAEVFAPLGLRSARVVEGPVDMRALAPGYTAMFGPTDAGRRDRRAVYHPGWVAHGLVAATAEDAGRFFDGLFGGALLSRSTLAAMTRLVPVPEAAPPPHGWGYGLGLMGNTDTPWGPVYGHEGGGPGYSAAAYHAPRCGGHAVTVVALLNTDAGEPARTLVFNLFDGVAA